MNIFKTLCLLVGFLLIIAAEGAARDPTASSKYKGVGKYNKYRENHVNTKNHQDRSNEVSKKKPRRNKKIKKQFLSKVRVVHLTKCEHKIKDVYEETMKEEPREGQARDILLLDIADAIPCPPIRIRICIRKDILNLKKVIQRCRRWGM